MSAQQSLKLIFSGGGTGGHIYPAIAVADQVRKLVPTADILFVGAEGRMEMQKVPQAGYRIIGLPVAGLQRRLTLQNLSLPFKIWKSLSKSAEVLRGFKPQAVAGFGGYASAPILYTAQRRGIPTLIQEQNSFAGLTNKLLGKRARRICVAYPGMEAYFPAQKILYTGNPVRAEIAQAYEKKAQALASFGLQQGRPVLLVIGGSLGARTLNQALAAGVQQLLQQGMQVIWQTGKTYWPEAQKQFTNLPGLAVMEFIKDMDLAYAAADLVVSRAGALSVSELCLTTLPTILVPSPNVVADHQTKNAQVLATAGAAMLLPDAEAPTQLITTVLDLKGDLPRQQALRRQIAGFAKPEATRQIALELLALAGYQG